MALLTAAPLIAPPPRSVSPPATKSAPAATNQSAQAGAPADNKLPKVSNKASSQGRKVSFQDLLLGAIQLQVALPINSQPFAHSGTDSSPGTISHDGSVQGVNGQTGQQAEANG